MRRILMASAIVAISMGTVACSSSNAADEAAAAQEAERAAAEAEANRLAAEAEEARIAADRAAAEKAARDAEAARLRAEAERARIAATTAGPALGSVADFANKAQDRVFFDLDQYRLTADSQEVLKRQAAWLESYPAVKILVAGNCDERGTREYNLALGERRASVVKDYLVSLGVDPARVQTVSYGKERPLIAESNSAAWAMNRNGFTQIISGAVG